MDFNSRWAYGEYSKKNGKIGVFLEIVSLCMFEFRLIGTKAAFFRATKYLKKSPGALQFERYFDNIM